MARRRREKMNLPMALASVLFCLVLFSLHFTSGLYARYVSTAEGSDSSKVASFGRITLIESGDFTNETKTAIIIPGADLTKNAKVSFTASEVAVYIIAEADLSAQWQTADNRTFSIKDGEKVQLEWSVENDWTFLRKDGNRYVYYRELAPNTALTDETIIADGGKITVSKEITRQEISSLTDIKINLRAFAVQAGGEGFTVSDAWEKVKNIE